MVEPSRERNPFFAVGSRRDSAQPQTVASTLRFDLFQPFFRGSEPEPQLQDEGKEGSVEAAFRLKTVRFIDQKDSHLV